ncbi:MAG: lysophospholipid acyltransferase family protein [Polyangiaceae bacterium]
MSLYQTLNAIGITARICFPTVLESFTNSVVLDECDERLAWWSRELLRQAHVDLHVRGLENLPAREDQPLVVMSNHRSYYDIPTAFCVVPGRLRMVAKKELFRVPIFGAAMLASGFVKIDRAKRESAIETLRESEKLLAGGMRIWIAPEGTRSKDGQLGEFKSGGFHMAIEANVPILPLVMKGTEKVLPHDKVAVQPGAKVYVDVLPPIDPAPFGQSGRKELMQFVRAQMAAGLARVPESV